MVAAGVVTMSRAMVGRAMLAIALSSTAMETAIASVAMARRRALGGSPSSRSIRLGPMLCLPTVAANLTWETPANKLPNRTDIRSRNDAHANRRLGAVARVGGDGRHVDRHVPRQ